MGDAHGTSHGTMAFDFSREPPYMGMNVALKYGFSFF